MHYLCSMTVERFINHVYYSYASVDRLLTYNPVSIEARENAVYTATITLSIALSGYILGMLYVICLLLIQISDEHVICNSDYFRINSSFLLKTR